MEKRFDLWGISFESVKSKQIKHQV